MKRLEGEVLDALDDLGEPHSAPRLAMEGETVSPRQFHGLEINPRAVPIADLVLWIGYLKWQLRTVKAEDIAEPVLHAYGTIKEQDAILAWDKQELLRDEHGVPLSRWDGVTTKLHPITGEEIPDPDATVDLYRYENPQGTTWPSADFVIGNPPFIGNKRLRNMLGWSYVDCLFEVYPEVSRSSDYVMYWWDKSAKLLREGKLCRFGLVTTNSIKQGSISESYASPRHGGGEAGPIVGAGGEADEVEPAQVVVQIAGGDAAAGAQEVLQPTVAAVHRLHMQIAPNPFPHRAVECFVAHPERGGARWVARAAVGDQQGVLRDHRVEGSRERRRIDPGQHRADRRPAPVRRHENRHLLAREAALLRLAAPAAVPCVPARARPSGSPGRRSRPLPRSP